MTKTKNVTVRIEPIHAAFTPFAMAGISEDLYQSSVSYSPANRFPVANFFLYAASIEIGLKAAILSKNCNSTNKKKIKDLNHNLDDVLKCFQCEFKDTKFSKEEIDLVSAVNVFYQDKGLEYFTTPMLGQALTAFKDFPPLKDFSKVAKKVNEFIKNNKNFIQSNTSEDSVKGFINFT